MRHCHAVGATLSAALALIGTEADAAVILVPSSAPSIKAAVDMAASGDEIVVGSNTWSGADNRDVHLQGKQLWIHSAAGPGECIIDTGRLGRGFILDGGEPAGTVIEGITFRNCRALGFTQGEFGHHFGLTVRQVSQLETGAANPTVATLERILAPLGLTVGFIPQPKPLT